MLIDIEDQYDISNEDKSGLIAEKFLQLHSERIDSIRSLAPRFPREGEIFFLWTVNSFNAFTFIPYIIRHSGVINELILSTYSINIRIIDALIRLIDRDQIQQVDIFISDSIKSRLPKVYDHLMAIIEKKPVRVYFSWNHSKIALIRSGDHYFDVEGSGNWGENAQHEQYVFLNSRNIYEFRKNEIIHGIERRSV
ncbi:MAG TPA: hypothetical protein PLK82_02360 [Bacteroidales bacterium]|nr:hypothetical protein [Bacteroidales bacterium]